MAVKAPRLSARMWRPAVRGAVLSLVCVATGAVADPIVDARYDGPTTRYPHGVLGDAVEHDTLVVRLASGQELRATWPDPIVFEDTHPRLVDLDGDETPEVMVVESHQQYGARLAIWSVDQGALTRLAQTPFIGTRYRWLAPVGAADLDGDGAVEVAYVDRPHLAKTLRVWRFERGGEEASLSEIASKPGLTNHKIGQDYITGGIRECGEGPEIVTADAQWQNIMVTRLIDGNLVSRAVVPFDGQAAVKSVLSCKK
ncbi:VCBS repeat-containing protein [Aliiroseovarius sp. KMU-50]|uniref:VCBS repeat-containing protein n=1 Tax=Aliiroseovarius salicola TaxID=3009082 RepID=A0ABT4VYM4_9RHOB|nr:VCBS repeat-containing protein [Aliiroseovarius sp. KMU-50]MDA5093371.1 VCBS repeat-containing protein [Aliiroseovarius sp. KMU-50]